MAGRKPKPTAEKRLGGNPGKRKLPEREPQLAVKVPRMPSWLPPKAKTAWKELAPLLAEMRVITEADKKALEMLVDAYCLYRDARSVLMKKGLTYETISREGAIRVNKRPEASIALEAHKRVMSCLAEFGLTPSSRSKVSMLQEAAEDPYEAFRREKRGRRLQAVK